MSDRMRDERGFALMAVVMGIGALLFIVIVIFQGAAREYRGAQYHRRDDTVIAGAEARHVRHYEADERHHACDAHGRAGEPCSHPNRRKAGSLQRQAEGLGRLVAQAQDVHVPGEHHRGDQTYARVRKDDPQVFPAAAEQTAGKPGKRCLRRQVRRHEHHRCPGRKE